MTNLVLNGQAISVNGNVAANFLQINGDYVIDPNVANALTTPIYADSAGQIQLQNPNG